MSELTKTAVQLLGILSDGEFHSGESLGQQLGVSRAAVWKCVGNFSKIGIPLVSVKGRGYHIPGGLDLLNLERIQSYLFRRLAEAPAIELFSVIESTNAYLLSAPIGGERICLCECQTAGRGRRGRRWESPYGQNIYMSLAFSVKEGMAGFDGLSLAVAVTLVELFESLGLDGIRLKWPNDLLYDGKKLAGILIEMRGDPMGEAQLITGVGINYSMPEPSTWDALIEQPWIDLANIAQQQQVTLPDRSEFSALLIHSLVTLHRGFQLVGFAEYRERWLRYAAHLNQKVCVVQSNRSIEGVMMGLGDTGAILLHTDTGVAEYHSGDVSLRANA